MVPPLKIFILKTFEIALSSPCPVIIWELEGVEVKNNTQMLKIILNDCWFFHSVFDCRFHKVDFHLFIYYQYFTEEEILPYWYYTLTIFIPL